MTKNTYLAHYGVKGQKWGQQKDPEQTLEEASGGPGGSKSISIEEIRENLNRLEEMFKQGEIDEKRYAELKTKYMQLEKKIRNRIEDQKESMQHDYLMHYGIPKMKWGFRRFQNKDGTLTPEGRKRYGVGPEKAGKKYSTVRVAGMEAKYQVKKTGSDLAAQRRAAVTASRVRRAKNRTDRYERKEQRKKEKAEALARKIAARESKKKLSDLKAEFDEARMNDARRKVEALTKKRERIKEKAYLKEQAKVLKKSMKLDKKQAKKDARLMFSKKDIRNLSDEELKARVNRLETEIKLAGLEAERMAPKITAGSKMVGGWLEKGLSTTASQLIGAKATALGKEAFGLSDEEINEFIRLTKKK